MGFLTFLFSAVLLLIWIISGGFITQSNVILTKYKGEDDFLKSAYWYSFAAAFITWFLVAVFIILIILAVVGVIGLFGSGVGEAGLAKGAVTGKAKTKGISWFTIIALIAAMILVAVTGVLSVYTAVYITKSPFFTGSDKADIPQLQKAYTNSIISASLCLGALGLLIIGFVTYFFVSRQRKKKADAAARKGSEIEVQKRELLKTAKEAELREKLQHQKELRDRITKASEDALVERISHNTAYPPPPVLTPAST